MAREIFLDHMLCKFDTRDGQINVEVWREVDGLGLQFELPSAEKVPCRYIDGKLVPLFIDHYESRAAFTDITLIASIPRSISPELDAIGEQAAVEFLAQQADSQLIG